MRKESPRKPSPHPSCSVQAIKKGPESIHSLVPLPAVFSTPCGERFRAKPHTCQAFDSLEFGTGSCGPKFPFERLSPMRQYDTVRLILTTHLTNYDIAAATDVAESTVRRYRKLAAEKSLTWDALKDHDFDAFHRVFNKPSPRRRSELLPNLAELDAELLRCRMPLQVWWEDQKSEYPATTPSYSYLSAELRRYRA